MEKTGWNLGREKSTNKTAATLNFVPKYLLTDYFLTHSREGLLLLLLWNAIYVIALPVLVCVTDTSYCLKVNPV